MSVISVHLLTAHDTDAAVVDQVKATSSKSGDADGNDSTKVTPSGSDTDPTVSGVGSETALHLHQRSLHRRYSRSTSLFLHLLRDWKSRDSDAASR